MIDSTEYCELPELRPDGALPGDSDWLDVDALDLTGDDIAALSEDQCLHAFASVRRLRARADALEAQAVARFTEVRGDANDTADEVARELRLTRHRARQRIRRGTQLTRRHPGVLAALYAGHVEAYGASRVIELTEPCSDEQARAVDALVADRLGDCRNPTAVRRLARQAVLQVAPDSQARRPTRRCAERKFELVPGKNSMATLRAHLPGDVASAVYRSIEAAARARSNAGDERTLDQLRADIVSERLGGSEASGDSQAPVLSPADAAPDVIGIEGEAEKDGLSAPIAHHVRGAKPSIWRKVIFDRATGAVFDLSRRRDRLNQQRRRSTTSRRVDAAGSPVDGRRTA